MKKICEDPKDPLSNAFQFEKAREKRKGLQVKHLNDYESGLDDLKVKLKTNEEKDIEETLLDDGRNKIKQFMDFNNNEPPKNVQDLKNLMDVAKHSEDEYGGKKKKGDKKKGEKKKDKEKGGKKGKKASPEDDFMKKHVWKGPSETVNEVEKIVGTFAKEWESNENDKKNFD